MEETNVVFEDEFPRYKDDGFGWIEPGNESNKDLKQVKLKMIEGLLKIK
jgi:hypothetical protein